MTVGLQTGQGEPPEMKKVENVTRSRGRGGSSTELGLCSEDFPQTEKSLSRKAKGDCWQQ